MEEEEKQERTFEEKVRKKESTVTETTKIAIKAEKLRWMLLLLLLMLMMLLLHRLALKFVPNPFFVYTWDFAMHTVHIHHSPTYTHIWVRASEKKLAREWRVCVNIVSTQKSTVNILVLVLIIERKRSGNLQTIATLNLTHVNIIPVRGKLENFQNTHADELYYTVVLGWELLIYVYEKIECIRRHKKCITHSHTLTHTRGSKWFYDIMWVIKISSRLSATVMDTKITLKQ